MTDTGHHPQFKGKYPITNSFSFDLNIVIGYISIQHLIKNIFQIVRWFKMFGKIILSLTLAATLIEGKAHFWDTPTRARAGK